MCNFFKKGIYLCYEHGNIFMTIYDTNILYNNIYNEKYKYISYLSSNKFNKKIINKRYKNVLKIFF
jgi:hypothetical protein